MNHQCYQKSEFYATCKESCQKGVDPAMAWDGSWSCNELGSRTPGMASSAIQAPAGNVQPWVLSKCGYETNNCKESKCCVGVGQQCYEKNDEWAQCKDECTTEPDPLDNNATWTCKTLGSKGWGLALRGYPSLFCYSVMRQEGYEPGLMKAQMAKGVGIFACDGYEILADAKFTLGKAPNGGPTGKDEPIVTIPIPKIKVGISQDGTAANAKLFM